MEEKEIDLVEVWDLIKKNFIKYILFGIFLATLMFAISEFLITPKYEASTSLIVNSEDRNNNQDNVQLNDIQVNQKLVGTYTEIVKTRGIADMVINNLGLDISYEDFSDMVSVESKNDTEIFEIKVVDTIPERAADIANETSSVFKDSIVEIMNVDNVQILDKAIVPEDPSSPKTMKNTVIGFVLGFILSMIVSIIKLTADTTIKTAEDITSEFDLPVIGMIPDRRL